MKKEKEQKEGKTKRKSREMGWPSDYQRTREVCAWVLDSALRAE